MVRNNKNIRVYTELLKMVQAILDSCTGFNNTQLATLDHGSDPDDIANWNVTTYRHFGKNRIDLAECREQIAFAVQGVRRKYDLELS